MSETARFLDEKRILSIINYFLMQNRKSGSDQFSVQLRELEDLTRGFNYPEFVQSLLGKKIPKLETKPIEMYHLIENSSIVNKYLKKENIPLSISYTTQEPIIDNVFKFINYFLVEQKKESITNKVRKALPKHTQNSVDPNYQIPELVKDFYKTFFDLLKAIYPGIDNIINPPDDDDEYDHVEEDSFEEEEDKDDGKTPEEKEKAKQKRKEEIERLKKEREEKREKEREEKEKAKQERQPKEIDYDVVQQAFEYAEIPFLITKEETEDDQPRQNLLILQLYFVMQFYNDEGDKFQAKLNLALHRKLLNLGFLTPKTLNGMLRQLKVAFFRYGIQNSNKTEDEKKEIAKKIGLDFLYADNTYGVDQDQDKGDETEEQSQSVTASSKAAGPTYTKTRDEQEAEYFKIIDDKQTFSEDDVQTAFETYFKRFLELYDNQEDEISQASAHILTLSHLSKSIYASVPNSKKVNDFLKNEVKNRYFDIEELRQRLADSTNYIKKYCNRKIIISEIEKRSILLSFKQQAYKAIFAFLKCSEKVPQDIIPYFPLNIFDDDINDNLNEIKQIFNDIENLKKDTSKDQQTYDAPSNYVMRENVRMNVIEIPAHQAGNIPIDY